MNTKKFPEGVFEITDDAAENQKRRNLMSPDQYFEKRKPVLADEGLRVSSIGMGRAVLWQAAAALRNGTYAKSASDFQRQLDAAAAMSDRLVKEGVPEEDIRHVLVDMLGNATAAVKALLVQLAKVNAPANPNWANEPNPNWEAGKPAAPE